MNKLVGTCLTRRKGNSVHTLTQAGEPHPSASARGPPADPPLPLPPATRPRGHRRKDLPPRLSFSAGALDSTVSPQWAHPPASLTSNDNARQCPQRQQSCPEPPRPLRSHPVRCPSHTARHGEPGAHGCFSRGGREGEGRGHSGWDARGGPRACAPSPRAHVWTLPEAVSERLSSEPSPDL